MMMMMTTMVRLIALVMVMATVIMLIFKFVQQSWSCEV